MRNPDRIPIVLDQLKKIWEQYPDMRLGQLIHAAGSNSWSSEDYELLDSLARRIDVSLDEDKRPEYWIGENPWANIKKLDEFR